MLGDAARAAGGTGDPMIVDAIDAGGAGDAGGGDDAGDGDDGDDGDDAVVDDTIVDVAPATDTVDAVDPAPDTVDAVDPATDTVAVGSAAGGPTASGGRVVSTSSADEAAAIGPTGAYGLGAATAPRCCVFLVTT